MAAEELSQAELDTLFDSKDSGIELSGEDGLACSAIHHNTGWARPTGSSEDRYDFKRPQRATVERMRVLEGLHEGIPSGLGVALSAQLRSVVDINLATVDQLTYGEIVLRLNHPTCLPGADNGKRRSC